jgi:hypothetical protein
MSAQDTTTLGPALMQKYATPMYYKGGYSKFPLWAMFKKQTDFGGDNKAIVLRITTVQGMNPNFANAQSAATPSEYRRVTVTHARGFGSAFIDSEAISRSKSEEDSLAKASAEVDSGMQGMLRGLSRSLFLNTGGAIGRATFSTTTATLVDDNGNSAPNLAFNFERGQRIQLSANDGTSGSLRNGGSYVTLLGVNRVAGTLLADANWSTITGATANDYLFQQGFWGANLAGLQSWIPSTAPTAGESFFGCDRSIDSRLYGFWITGNGAPMKETMINCLAVLGREGADTDVIVMNNLDWANFINGEQSNVIYDRAKSMDDPKIGFQAFKIMGPKGLVDVIADPDCPRGKFFALQLDTWSFQSSGPAPRINNDDGLGPLVRVYNANQVECRLCWYGNLFCEAPGLNGGGTF